MTKRDTDRPPRAALGSRPTRHRASAGTIDFDGPALLDFVLSVAPPGRTRLSAYAPMVRAGDTQQNPRRMKNLLKEARDKLDRAGLGKREIAALVGEVERRVTGRVLAEQQDHGLAIFAESGRCLAVRCPEPVVQQTVVGEPYYVLPLLPLLGETPRFTVLAVSQKRVRLIEASRDRGEERTAEVAGLPRRLTDITGDVVRQDSLQQHSPQPTKPAIFHGQGAGDDDAQPELERYCQAIAGAVAAELGAHRRVVLAGDVRLRAMLRRAAKHLSLTSADLDGNHDVTPPRELAARGWQIVLAAARADAAACAARFHREAGRNRASDAAATIFAAAEDGRVEVLLVDSGFATGAEEAEHHQAVNDAALATLRNGGTVRAIERGSMPNDSPLAALLRY